MTKKVEKFVFNGYEATVILPETKNGKWIWKTEFLYAFDQAEQELNGKGYTRVYYNISDKYGSDKAIRLMRKFHNFVVKKYNLTEKAILFGFSRGGLYAFNYSLYYPEKVEKIYLDAPVLDLKSWPLSDSLEQKEMFQEYSLNKETLKIFNANPVDNLSEFFSLNIPLLLVAGEADELVPLKENAGILIDYCEKHHILIEKYIKKECGHHPHSLEDVTPIVKFVER